jgi:uncharacterized protein YkwD
VVLALLRRLIPLAAFAALAIVPSTAAAAAGCPGANAAPVSAEAPAATLCLINAQRTSRGLAPLALDAQLGRAATAFANDMVARQFFDHVSPDGVTLLDRLRDAGWLPSSGAWTAGENIAWGSSDLGTPAGIVAAWMASPGHRANILRPSFATIGLGIAPGAPQPGVADMAGTYVTDFGTRAAAHSSAAARHRPTNRCSDAARAGKSARHCSARR